MKHQIPNFITLLNLFSGCLSIYFTLVNGDIQLASWAIVCAAIFDLLDGLFARLLKVQSKIGADLDSLSDVVSFGVAPAMMVFSALMAIKGEYTFYLALPAFIIAMLSEYRLAKFNNDTRARDSFFGLPVPANALFWIGAVGLIPLCQTYITRTVTLYLLVYLFIGLSAWIMVSNIRLLSLKVHFPLKTKKDRWLLCYALILLVLGGGLVFYLSWVGASILILIYIASSIVINKMTN